MRGLVVERALPNGALARRPPGVAETSNESQGQTIAPGESRGPVLSPALLFPRRRVRMEYRRLKRPAWNPVAVSAVHLMRLSARAGDKPV
jgi:hypothetical protein